MDPSGEGPPFSEAKRSPEENRVQIGLVARSPAFAGAEDMEIHFTRSSKRVAELASQAGTLPERLVTNVIAVI